MNISGKLRLKHDDDSYLISTGGRLVNISDYLYLLYKEKAIVETRISDTYTKIVLFEANGELYKERTAPKFYTYHISETGKYNLDHVLWNNVGRKIEVYIRNITK